jgi:hypothetical protein
MMWPSKNDILSFPLRGLIAVAARGVRRVHPLGADDWRPLRSRISAIGLAESFAVGEPLTDADDKPLTPQRVIDELGSPGSDTPADRAAQELEYAVFGAMELVASARGVSEDTRAHAEASLELAREAAAGKGGPDRELFEGAVREDLHKLASNLDPRLQAAEDDWLGAPLEPGELGPLGELWPWDRKPSWYSPPTPIIKGLSPDDEAQPESADVFCWQVNDPRTVETILAKIKTAQERAAILRKSAGSEITTTLLPVFVVHARNLDGESIGKLIWAGATVLDDAAFEGSSPTSSRELVERIHQMISNEDRLGGGDWWRYDEPRYPWRQPAEEREAVDETEAKADGGAYEKIYSRSQAVDLSKEEGWPVGS